VQNLSFPKQQQQQQDPRSPKTVSEESQILVLKGKRLILGRMVQLRKGRRAVRLVGNKQRWVVRRDMEGKKREREQKVSFELRLRSFKTENNERPAASLLLSNSMLRV